MFSEGRVECVGEFQKNIALEHDSVCENGVAWPEIPPMLFGKFVFCVVRKRTRWFELQDVTVW